MPFRPPARRAIAAIGLGLGLGLGLMLISDAVAQQAPPSAADEAPPVYTRARFKSRHDDGGKAYVRLTLVPRAKLPFSTQTFRLADRALLDGIAEDSPVEFVARRIDGENTVVAIRAVAACPRFQKC